MGIYYFMLYILVQLFPLRLFLSSLYVSNPDSRVLGINSQ